MEHLGTKQFSGLADDWTQALCLEVLPDGACIPSSRSNEVLEQLCDLELPVDDDGDTQIPETLNDKSVWRDGDFLVSENLVLHSDESVATFSRGDAENTLAWLTGYGWTEAGNWPSIESRVVKSLVKTGWRLARLASPAEAAA